MNSPLGRFVGKVREPTAMLQLPECQFIDTDKPAEMTPDFTTLTFHCVHAGGECGCAHTVVAVMGEDGVVSVYVNGQHSHNATSVQGNRKLLQIDAQENDSQSIGTSLSFQWRLTS